MSARGTVRRILGGRLLEVDKAHSTLTPPVDVVVVDGVIDAVDPARTDTREGLDARGLLVLPGLVNGHTHSHEGFHRGRYPKLPLEVWMHYVRPPLDLGLTTEDVYLRTVLSALDALRGGATTVVDDVGLPEMREDHLAAVARAYRDVGVRAVVAPTMFDRTFAESVPFAVEEMPNALSRRLAAVPRADPDEALRRLVAVLDRHQPPHDRVTFGVAASAPQRCSDDYLTALVRVARNAGAPVVTHVNETRLQAVTAQLQYGSTMTAHLEALEVLDARLSLIHGIWLTRGDIASIARREASVQHNPVSNLRLGGGVAPVAMLRAAGVNVTLGSDGVGSCVSNGMTAVVREAALLGALHDDGPQSWLSAADALRMGTENGARALGMAAHIGRVAPGLRADLIGVALSDPAFTPLNDPLRQLVYGDARVDTVIVDGDVVLHHGRIRTIDERRMRADIRAAHARLEPAIRRADAFVTEEMGPVFRRVLARANTHPIPEDTVPVTLPRSART